MYEVVVSNLAKRQLERLDSAAAKRVTNKLMQLEQEPRPTGCLKLKGKFGYRLRIGNYRVL